MTPITLDYDSGAAESAAERILSVSEKNAGDEELSKACQEFEAYFLRELFKSMRKTVVSNDESNASRIFQDMSDDAVAKNAADQGGFGLAAFMFRQLRRDADAI